MKIMIDLKKKLKEESGQATVMLALALVALMGCAALAVDLGFSFRTKTVLQDAADAAAMAAAKLLPDKEAAEAEARRIADANGAYLAEMTLTTPYNENARFVEVVLRQNVEFGFARAIGFRDGDVAARAVAQKEPPMWAGEALPFINLDDDYLVDSRVIIWEKTGPGDFESLWKNEFEMFNLGPNDDHSKGYFLVDYGDGITVTKGVVANIKQEVGYVYEQHKPQYVFSLRSDKIGQYYKLKNQFTFPLEDLVLLQVIFDDYDLQGKHLYLTVTGVYDFNSGDFPTQYLLNENHVHISLVD